MAGSAVLLMAHGSPETPDQMEPFLRRVMTRRAPSPEFVREMQSRYATFGGRSPLLDIARRQAAALEKRLGVPVRVGMRHWAPLIADAVAELEAAGAKRIVGIALAPQYCAVSVGAYHEAMRAAAKSARVLAVRHWHREEPLLELWARNLRGAGDAPVLFTAHSVPVEESDPYAVEVRETIDGVVARLGDVEWDLAWQSRSPGPGIWLEPDVDTKLKEKRDRGWNAVRVAPIGFVCDHAEVLYDLDHLHRGTADRLGVAFDRVAMPNDAPELIDALEAVARRGL